MDCRQFSMLFVCVTHELETDSVIRLNWLAINHKEFALLSIILDLYRKKNFVLFDFTMCSIDGWLRFVRLLNSMKWIFFFFFCKTQF